MKVVNVHQRLMHAKPADVGALIDSLSSPHDKLWPGRNWPRMKLDRPLGIGATGGHGPIRYFVDAYAPSHAVRFRFTRPHGFDGWHCFEVIDATAAHCVLEHRIEMQARGFAALLWLLAIRPLHDMCVEEALSQAQISLGNQPKPVIWPLYTKLLHWLMTQRKRPAAAMKGQSHAS